MSKAYEIMTQSLATCSPDDSAAHVAMIMRDRDIGNVLIVDDGKLRGIVTDRDLAVQALADHGDPGQTSIRNFMSTRVVTGNPDWSLEKVARTMAKHQVRRLPILENDQLVGIVSLGDVAKHSNRHAVVTKSLRAISALPEERKADGAGRKGAILGLSLAALASTAVALLTWNRSGKELRKQMADTRFYQQAQQAVNTARDRVDEAASSKPVRNFRQQMRANIKELSTQLPSIEYKPPKRKPIWFR